MPDTNDDLCLAVVAVVVVVAVVAVVAVVVVVTVTVIVVLVVLNFFCSCRCYSICFPCSVLYLS